MKATLTVLFVLTVLAATGPASGQRTEVHVQKGKVLAATARESVAVEAGRKAILAPGQTPLITVDDPMVDDVMEIHQWVAEEEAAQRQTIESSSIFVYSLEKPDRLTFAGLMEFPNPKSEPSATFRLGEVSPILGGPKFYDLEGQLLPFETELVTERSAYYLVRFRQPVPPGEKFRFILVSTPNNLAEWGLWQDGPLWHLSGGNHVPNCLNYYRIILPESAIFVDADRLVLTADNVNGRVAVTLRNYTGPTADSVFLVGFLWPDRDGTSLADLPRQYRGLRDPREEEIVAKGRVELDRIVSGQSFDDQGNPLHTLLSLYSALAHKDRNQLLRLIDNPILKKNVTDQFDILTGAASEVLLQQYEFLGTPSWPQAPEDGAIHPVYLCRKGSLLGELILSFVSRDGRWYLQEIKPSRSEERGTQAQGTGAPPAIRVFPGTQADLAQATYAGLVPGQFLRKWLFLGPVSVPWNGPGYFPDDETAQKTFESDDLPELIRFQARIRLGEKTYAWALLESHYGVVDLSQVFDDWYVSGYAWAQIEMERETRAVLGIGSDDGVKVWLNGELVHSHWALRGVVPDNDLVPVTFRQGQNQLVLKIQNAGGAWGFSCRVLE